MCSCDPFQFRWLKGYIHNSCYYHHQIGSINLTHYYHIFRWLCAWDVCYIIFCHLLHIHSGKTVIVFSLLLCSLFVHYTTSLSSLCKLIWRHWTYKMAVRYIWLSVRVRLNIFSQLSIIQYMCVFSLPIYLVMIERIHTLSYYHHEIGSMNFYPLFSVRSWNNGMCCMSLYILLMVSHTVWKRDNASFLLIKHILYLTLMCEQWKSAVGTWGKTTRTSIYTHVLTLLVLRLEYSGRTRTKP